MAENTEGALSADEMIRLLQLVKESDSIELKLTVPESAYRSTAQALDLDPLDAQIRQVFFFDTPDLTLNQAGVVLRARRVQGDVGDTTVKLRPVVPSDLPKNLRQSPNLTVEVDAMRTGYVCSAALKKEVSAEEVRNNLSKGKALRKLFSKEQRAFYDDHAPEGIAIDDLATLGPIFVLKLKTVPKGFGRKVTGEMWIYPDGRRVMELSTKCAPGEGVQVAAEARDFLQSKGIEAGGEQQTKTKTALTFFSEELRARQAAGETDAPA